MGDKQEHTNHSVDLVCDDGPHGIHAITPHPQQHTNGKSDFNLDDTDLYPKPLSTQTSGTADREVEDATEINNATPRDGDSGADDDGDSFDDSSRRFISDSEEEEMGSDDTYVYNCLQCQKVDDLKKFATLLSVPKKGETELRKQQLVYCLFTKLHISSKKKERTIREQTKLVLVNAYNSFGNRWLSLVRRKKVERVPNLEVMATYYNGVMKHVTGE